MIRNYVCDDVGGFSVLTLGLFWFVASSIRYHTIFFSYSHRSALQLAARRLPARCSRVLEPVPVQYLKKFGLIQN